MQHQISETLTYSQYLKTPSVLLCEAKRFLKYQIGAHLVNNLTVPLVMGGMSAGDYAYVLARLDTTLITMVCGYWAVTHVMGFAQTKRRQASALQG